MNQTMSETRLGGLFTFPGTSLTVQRIGYGAMKLAGPGVFGPPANPDKALAVLREVVKMGINHIDTSDYYGPHVTNKLIKEAVSPYPDNLVIVTKIGCIRGKDGSWIPSRSRESLTEQVHDNLKNLGVGILDIVNLRLGGGHDGHSPVPGSIAEPFTALAQLQQEGLVRHIGISTVNAEQIAEAQSIAPVVCVQNMYNIAHRDDDDLIDSLAAQGIAYVPYFPLGGFTPLQSSTLTAVAKQLGAKPMQVSLAWLLQRSPNILLIPGTTSIVHLHENLALEQLTLSPDILTELERIAVA